MMASAQVVETSVNTNNSPQDYTTNPDDHSNHNIDSPGFKPFTVITATVSMLSVNDIKEDLCMASEGRDYETTVKVDIGVNMRKKRLVSNVQKDLPALLTAVDFTCIVCRGRAGTASKQYWCRVITVS